MLCQRCNKNEATTIFTQTINGHTTTEHICSECAAKSEMNNFFNGFSLFNFNNILNNFNHYAAEEQKRCPKCGSTLYDIKQNGRMGCSECYKTFSKELEGTIQGIHGKAVHTGKRPGVLSVTATEDKKDENKVSENSELRQLEDKLNESIKEQNFEAAAQYRDKINELKNNNSNNSQRK